MEKRNSGGKSFRLRVFSKMNPHTAAILKKYIYIRYTIFSGNVQAMRENNMLKKSVFHFFSKNQRAEQQKNRRIAKNP